MIRLSCLVLALFLAGCDTTSVPVPPRTGPPAAVAVPSDLELTWLQAVVMLPAPSGNVVAHRMADLRGGVGVPAATVPTVIYLHGCTGLGDDLSFLRGLAEAGFAVIAPDSMARRYRPLQCDPATGRGGYNPFVYDFRMAEIGYALQAMAQLSWVDQGNLFLIGGSEGGVPAALFRGNAFQARVITDWTCHGAPVIAGLEAPIDEPVLAVVAANDPWYRNGAAYGQEGDCGAYMTGRPLARSVVLPAPLGHGVLLNPDVREMVTEFLLANIHR